MGYYHTFLASICVFFCLVSISTSSPNRRQIRNPRFDEAVKPPMCKKDVFPEKTICACGGFPGALNVDCSDVKTDQDLKQLFINTNHEEYRYRAIDIHDSQITKLPSGVFGNAQFFLFNLDDNKLESVADDVFKNSKETANIIRLQNNALTSFPFESLDEFDELVFINVTNNKIESLPQNGFQKMAQLRYLGLGQNQIAAIPSGAFKKLGRLEKIELNDNQITELQEGAFEMSADLKEPVEIYLDNNKITKIGKNVFPTKLAKLSLIGNKLSYVDFETFKPILEALTANKGKLDLTGNQLSCSSDFANFKDVIVGMSC